MSERSHGPGGASARSRNLGAFGFLAVVAIAGLAFAMYGSSGGRGPIAMPTPTPVTSPPAFGEGTPAGVVHTYLEGDFAGERLERASWAKFQRMVLWPSEPKWDSAYVVRSFRVESGKQDKHDASADATFDTLGELDLEQFVYTTSPSEQTVPYMLTSNAKVGWLIAQPMLKPHSGPEATIAFLKRMRVGYPTLAYHIDASIKQIAADARKGRP